MTVKDKVLVVEDNTKNRKLFSLLLSSEGIEVVGAANGREGVEAARRERPDLVLMDIQMPEMDGICALEELRAREDTRRIPVIALTAYAMRGDEEKFLARGFDGYLSKPIEKETFLALVKKTLAEKKETA